MKVGCRSDQIDLLFLNKVYIKKEIVALIVILLDLGICYFLYYLFQYLRAMQFVCKAEVSGSSVVTA
jgi:hypothetical protein